VCPSITVLPVDTNFAGMLDLFLDFLAVPTNMHAVLVAPSRAAGRIQIKHKTQQAKHVAEKAGNH
jgi:hypothetical protein